MSADHVLGFFSGLLRRPGVFGFEEPTPDVGALFLHEDQRRVFDVVGASQFQADLAEIVGPDKEGPHNVACIATLELTDRKPQEGGVVAVRVHGRLVGHCPSYLATRYRRWIHAWRLVDANVMCRATIVDRGDDYSGANPRFAVRLSIELPFKISAAS